MAPVAALAHPARPSRDAPGESTTSRRALFAALFLGALLISGFTILRGGAPFDEGLVLQAARRVTDGQMPYRDFLWPYGPAQPYLFGASFDLFGTSLLWWRILRVICDAVVAVTVYSLVRREASHRLALAGWLAAACAMAQPTSATPFPAALALGLIGFAIATRTPVQRRDALVAGGLVGLATAWRLDFGIYAGGAVVLALALSATGRGARLATFVAAAMAVALAAYLPFLVAIGPADLYDSLVGSSLRERDFWNLPFPLAYDGALSAWPPGALAEDAKDLVGYYLPAICVVGLGLSALALLATRPRGGSTLARSVGLVTFAVGGLLYLLSRTDEFHTTPLVVLLAVALPVALAKGVPRPLGFALAGILVLLAGYGAANRLSALLQPPDLTAIDVPVADGAKAPPAEAEAIERMVAGVQRVASPDEPIYAITARADLVRFNQPLIYVLTQRDNPTDRDFGLQTSAAEQRRTVAALERSRPAAIVRWTDPISAVREPNLRGRSSGSRALDRYVAAEYRRLDAYGDYEVLVPR